MLSREMIFLAELKMMEIKFLLLAECPVSGSGAMEALVLSTSRIFSN